MADALRGGFNSEEGFVVSSDRRTRDIVDALTLTTGSGVINHYEGTSATGLGAAIIVTTILARRCGQILSAQLSSDRYLLLLGSCAGSLVDVMVIGPWRALTKRRNAWRARAAPY